MNTIPCYPALVMSQHGTANPIAVVDEVDKADHSVRHGDPVAALLSLIEPGSAGNFWDRCLLAHVNVSHVNWIMTANSLDRLPAPLRSRLDIIHVDGPTADDFDILMPNLVDEIAGHWGMPHSFLPALAPEAEQLLRERFAKHRSIRHLDRELRNALAASIIATPRRVS